MEINVRRESRAVEIWLTKKEKQNARLREELKPLFQKYREQGYLAAVYESGEQDLWSAVGDLLCYNRRRIAQLEAEQCGMTMGI